MVVSPDFFRVYGVPVVIERPAGAARAFAFALRTAVPPATIVPAIRAAVGDIDPNLPITRISTQAGEAENAFKRDGKREDERPERCNRPATARGRHSY